MSKVKNKKVFTAGVSLCLAALILAGASRLSSKENNEPAVTALTPTAALTEDSAASKEAEASLLSKNADPAINTLMESYFAATLSGDKAAFESLVSTPDSIDFEQLIRKVEYIVDYENINCYTAQGINGIDLIVYVTYDLKLPSIDTAAPSIDEYYIYYDSNNEPKIYLGTLKEETAAYVNDIRSSKEVSSLINSVSDSLAAAIASDSSLEDFYSSFQSTQDAALEDTASEEISSFETSSSEETATSTEDASLSDTASSDTTPTE
ncbi:MAG: hypothetical protein E7256_16530 [Lachnospiraceae bacterium]|nr:hypothetical protein [Lachnospiraceae bacterium]